MEGQDAGGHCCAGPLFPSLTNNSYFLLRTHDSAKVYDEPKGRPEVSLQSVRPPVKKPVGVLRDSMPVGYRSRRGSTLAG